MRKLIYPQLVTLDGYVGGPKGELDWHVTTPDMHAVFNALQLSYGGYAMGRRTYEVMRGWDELGARPEDAAEYRGFHEGWIALPKLVVSSTLREVGPNASLAKGDPVAAVRALKAGEGRPIAIAGTQLAAALAAAGLIDEYVLLVHPVLLGGGTRLFRDGLGRQRLKLLDTEAYPSGIVRLDYAVER
jgi:dihydrofolate reductase